MEILGYTGEMLTLSKRVTDLEENNERHSKRIDRLRSKIEEYKHKVQYLDKLLMEKSN